MLLLYISEERTPRGTGVPGGNPHIHTDYGLLMKVLGWRSEGHRFKSYNHHVAHVGPLSKEFNPRWLKTVLRWNCKSLLDKLHTEQRWTPQLIVEGKNSGYCQTVKKEIYLKKKKKAFIIFLPSQPDVVLLLCHGRLVFQ